MGFPFCMLLEGTQGYILVEKFFSKGQRSNVGKSAKTPNFHLYMDVCILKICKLDMGGVHPVFTWCLPTVYQLFIWCSLNVQVLLLCSSCYVHPLVLSLLNVYVQHYSLAVHAMFTCCSHAEQWVNTA